MPLQYVSSIPIFVNDQDRALEFFVNKLGFTKGTDAQFGEGMRWLEVHTSEGNAILSLSNASAYDMEGMVGKHTGLVFHSDDVRGSVEQMRTNGVKITEDPIEHPWGVQAQFEDIDGNGYVIVGK